MIDYRVPDIAAAVDRARSADTRRASAAKRGRNPRFPFVPIWTYTDEAGGRRTKNPMHRRAYATRDEAVAVAEVLLDREYDLLARRLADPGNRALREHHGLPRELADLL
jgi:hypothetical protein